MDTETDNEVLYISYTMHGKLISSKLLLDQVYKNHPLKHHRMVPNMIVHCVEYGSYSRKFTYIFNMSVIIIVTQLNNC